LRPWTERAARGPLRPRPTCAAARRHRAGLRCGQVRRCSDTP
jgi:hypothetical protein